MRSYGKVSPRIWTGRLGHYMKGRHDLQTLVLYLATCPHQNLIGIFRVTTGYIRDDTGLPEDRCEELLRELAEIGYIYWDSEASVVWVTEHARHELGDKSSRQQKVAVGKALRDFAISPAVVAFTQRYPQHLPEEFQIDTLYNRVTEFKSIPYGSPSPSPLPSPAPITPPPAPSTPALEEGSVTNGSSPPHCPHQEIIQIYHELLPSLPRVESWEGERPGFLRARWRERQERQDVDWWKGYFEHVSKSDFLMGRVEGRSGSFTCNLEWLIRPRNFQNVLEGKYHDNKQGGPGHPPSRYRRLN